jgi:hypothetical protein
LCPYARDDYLGENVAEAEARLREYVSVLDNYMADSSWSALDPTTQFELEQMYDEMTGFQNTRLAAALAVWMILPVLLIYLLIERLGRRALSSGE